MHTPADSRLDTQPVKACAFSEQTAPFCYALCADTDFRQQRLKAWRPLCTGQKLTGCFFLTGLLFVAVGALLVWDASTVVQVEVEYDEQCCVENCNGVGVRRDMNPCFVNITVDKDMDGPVYLFYELREFYQNNRLVVNSRDDAQLKGFSRVPNDLECRDDTMFAVDGHLKNDFTQEYTVESDFNESDFNTMANEISPCGLMAYAFFNDTLEIGAGTSGADWTRLTTQYSDAIAWSSEDGTGWPNEKQASLTHGPRPIFPAHVTPRCFPHMSRPSVSRTCHAPFLPRM